MLILVPIIACNFCGGLPMAVRNIIKEGDQILHKHSKIVEKFDEKLAVLLDDMVETLQVSKGVGLAAPQIGILKRVVVVLVDDKIVEIVNPKIVKKLGKQEEVEGCLSCPGEYGITLRPQRVTVEGQNRYGENVVYDGEGITARAFCHEVDHLDGILFVDKAEELYDAEESED